MEDYRKNAIKEALRETKKDLFRMAGAAVTCIILSIIIERLLK